MSNTRYDIHNTIRLLGHIQENPESTQRELVEKLDISLGKVNFLIQSLVEKGMIKLKRFKNSHRKMAYLYLITPEGISQKTKITREFLKRRLEEYNNLKKEIEALKLAIDNSDTRDAIPASEYEEQR